MPTRADLKICLKATFLVRVVTNFETPADEVIAGKEPVVAKRAGPAGGRLTVTISGCIIRRNPGAYYLFQQHGLSWRIILKAI